MTTKGQALITVGRELFGLKNLIGTDFGDVSAYKVKSVFAQDTTGICFTFTVSDHALQKALSNEAYEALWSLVEETPE